MREALVLVVFLVFLFIVLWIIVNGLEKPLKRSEINGHDKREEVFRNKDLPIIIAGVMAYEESLKEKGPKRKREFYRTKEDKISWWRILGRAR